MRDAEGKVAKRSRHGTAAMFFVGLLVGAAAMALMRRDAPWSLPPVHAASADSVDGLCMATGAVSDDAEGIFFLNAATGMLTGSIFNPQAGVFNSEFRRHVAGDLKTEAIQNPRYLLLTGSIRIPQRSAQSIAGCIIYVVEAVSGNYAAYAIPWRKDLFASGRGQVGEFALLQTGAAARSPSAP